MRLLFLIFLAGLCFTAGYYTGKQHRYHDYVPPEIPSGDSEPAGDGADGAPAAEASEPEPEPESTPGPEPAPDDPPGPGADTRFPEEQMAERAKLAFVTLTDKNGRQLKAEILETTKNTVKVRRYRDRKVFDLPVETLSEEDRAYIAYLNRTGGAPPSGSGGGKSEEELLMEIFGDM